MVVVRPKVRLPVEKFAKGLSLNNKRTLGGTRVMLRSDKALACVKGGQSQGQGRSRTLTWFLLAIYFLALASNCEA